MAVSITPGPASPLGERLAATPRHICQALVGALGHGDLEAAVECFASDACLVLADGTAVHGEAAIRARLAELISSGAEARIELAGVIVAGETALAHERWRISRGGMADGGPAQAPFPTLALRRLAGEWRIAIAAPWGMAATKPLRAIWP